MTSQTIISFLKSHPAISVNRIEELAGVPKTTIAGAMAGLRSIPVDRIDAVVKVLNNYGLTEHHSGKIFKPLGRTNRTPKGK